MLILDCLIANTKFTRIFDQVSTSPLNQPHRYGWQLLGQTTNIRTNTHTHTHAYNVCTCVVCVCVVSDLQPACLPSDLLLLLPSTVKLRDKLCFLMGRCRSGICVCMCGCARIVVEPTTAMSRPHDNRERLCLRVDWQGW